MMETSGLVRDPARVAKSADAKDLKSFFAQAECGFKSRPGHHLTQLDRLNARNISLVSPVLFRGDIALV